MKKLSFLILSIFLLSSLGFQSQAQFANGSPFPKSQAQGVPYICGNQIHFKTQNPSTFLSTNDGINWMPVNKSCNPGYVPNRVDISKQKPQRTFPSGYNYLPKNQFVLGGKTYYVVEHKNKTSGRYQIAYVEGEGNLYTQFFGGRSMSLNKLKLYVHPQNPRKWVTVSNAKNHNEYKISLHLLNPDGRNEAKNKGLSFTGHSSLRRPQVVFVQNRLYIVLFELGSTKVRQFRLAPGTNNSMFLEGEQPVSIPNNDIADVLITPTANHALFYYKSLSNASEWNLGVIRPNGQLQLNLLNQAKINTTLTTTNPANTISPNVKKPTKPTLQRKTKKPTLNRKR